MGKKRRAEDPETPDTEVKKKKDVSEFNGTVFKAMLKEPISAMKGLETFISTAKKLPSPNLYDVVEGYIKISMECTEIFKLLEGEKHTENEMLLVFEGLEMVLLRTASDLSHFSMVGNTIVKRILSRHMKLLQGSFHSENHRFVRQCLGLLSAMVSQGPEAAREVLSHIHVNKALSALARRRDKKGKPDVRMAFVQFALSFLVSGDNATVGQVLESKEILPEILTTGLKEDRMSVVNLILSTLRSRVVLNKAITKTQKVRFFTAAVLASIASLYKWNGIVDAVAADDDGESERGGVAVVRELVHGFLGDLCCSRKHGIIFHDASFGTAGRPGNIVLLQFLVGLKHATEDDLVAELLVKTLRASPDLLARYLKETQYSYAPRLKGAWQDNVRLLKKIYEAQPEIGAVFQSGEARPLPQLLAMIMVVSLPPVCTKSFFTQGLNFTDAAVQLAALSALNFVLKKANKNLDYLLGAAETLPSDVYGPEVMADLAQQYREALSKILPDMTGIVSKWQSVSKKGKPDGDAKEKPKDEETDDDNRPAAAESAEAILLKALILQVICLYQKVVPHLVAQCKFDFSKLLKGVVSETGMRKEVAPVLQHQILQLALDLPASKFSWFRIQDDAESPAAEKSVLYLLLKMFVSSGGSHLRGSTRRLVLKVLKDSGVFEYTWAELEIWLDRLAGVEPRHQEEVIKFLERALVKLVCNSHTYTDKVAGLVQEAAYLQSNLSGGQEGDAASIPVSHIDDVLDMLDVIMEGNDGEMEELGPSLSEDLIGQTFPFSALVPAALEARNKLPADKGVVFEYLSAVLSDVLHSQREPLPLCLGLTQYDKELLAAAEPPAPPHRSIVHLHRYYSKWLPQQSREELFTPSECPLEETPTPSSLGALMAAAYCEEPRRLLEAPFERAVQESLASTPTADCPLAIKQILLYVKSTVENFGALPKNTGTGILKILMGILRDLVVKIQGSQGTSDPEVEEPAGDDEGSDLFLEVDQLPSVEDDQEQILLPALASIFKHPCLEQWYLALELAGSPPNSLNPVKLKLLCARLSDDITSLLSLSAPALRRLGRLDLLSPYMVAVERAVLRELSEVRAAEKQSRPLRAFLSLHSYMDFSSSREVVSRLLLLPQKSLVRSGSEANEDLLSVYGHAALQILTEAEASTDRTVSLSHAHLQGLSTLLLSCSSPALMSFLHRTLAGEPGTARLVRADVLPRCLRLLPDARDVCALLLRNSSMHRLLFEMWCLEPANVRELDEHLLPLVHSYMEEACKKDPARPEDVQQEVLSVLKRELLGKLIQDVLGDLTEDSAAQSVETLARLIRLSADVADIQDLIGGLPGALQKRDTFLRWELVDAVAEKMADRPGEQEAWRKSTAAAALGRLAVSYSHSKDPAAWQSAQEQGVLERLPALLTSPEDVAVSEWNAFVKNGLRYRYTHNHFLSALESLLEPMYGGGDSRTGLVPLATLHMMTSSHSLFLPTMLDPGDDPTKSRAKEALVSLLLRLVRKCPAVCNVNHFLVLLGAYGATLSTTDQNILLLLQEYEKNNVSLLKFQSILWGPAALEHHKARKSLGSSLWKQTGTDELLGLLSPEKMLRTITRFPRQRRIIPQEAKEQPGNRGDVGCDPGDLYDPCFLLPLFSAILRPECVTDCQKFVSTHAFGVTVAALSSSDPKARAAAYHVLACFYQHLEAARFREKKQLLYLIDTVKNGIRRPNQMLPFVLTTYVARAAQLMLRPEDHMYVVLNRFLLSHQSLDFKRVPEFFKLFYGFDLEHKTEREWILGVLEDGLSDGHSYELCRHQGVFQSLLAFGSGPLCDEPVQAQILRVLCRAARVNKAAYDLVSSCGLLTWIVQLLEKRNQGQHLLGAIIELLHALWFTVLGTKEERADESGVKCLPLPLIGEFISVASTVIGRLRSGVKAAQLGLFLETLCSALTHRGTALRFHLRAEWPTLRPRALSGAEALALLQGWASLARDALLLARVQAVAEKHGVKEVLESGKDRGRGRGSFSQGRAAKEKPAADGEAAEEEKKEEGLLARCKVSLGGILLHWEPAFPGLPEARPAQPGVGPAVDTALLLATWCLRRLVEDSHDDKRTTSFLRWLEGSAARREEIAAALAGDRAAGADLLRLYHRCARAGPPGGETLRLFTAIMIRLIESRGPPPEMHDAVVSSCLQRDDGDPSRRDAGLSLSSLYVHEVWSGATTPELFLSHVAMVTESKLKDRGSAKTPAGEPAVRAICDDFLSIAAAR